MDAKTLLEQLLQSGQELAQKGRELAEDKLDIPAEGEKREAMISGMQKGALAAGAMALLLGTRAGRAAGGAALKLGSLAAIGGLAYKPYQDWANGSDDENKDIAESVKPVNELEGEALDKRSTQLIRAMIAAAKADGHIDEAEKKRIDEQVREMGLADDAALFIVQEISMPLNIHEVTAGVDDPEAAVEVYLASRMVVDVENAPERLYLSSLAKALNLSDELVARLDKVVKSS